MMRKLSIVWFLWVVAAASFAQKRAPELFVTADRCMACHNGLITPQGQDASIGVGWRSSMMANSARDPYWQAAVRRETLVHPSASAVIENECGACHMPMHRFQANAEGQHGAVLRHLPLAAELTPESVLATDGVSCTVCHQIGPENLGEPESFTAGFALDTTTPAGERTAYGPFNVDQGRGRLMRSASRYSPAKGLHIQSSEVCATCHTLITHTLDDQGSVVGELPEQVPYLEWKHSAYAGETSCQSCHMPEVAGKLQISSVAGLYRDNVSQHTFRGGNFLLPRIFNQHRQELAVNAFPQEFQTTADQAIANLTDATAELVVSGTEISGDALIVDLSILNLAGHKLPSAYPSRRVWIHLTVRDRDGRALFESGRFNPDGSIEGNDNDMDGSSYEEHYEEISRPDQVQIYEPILTDPAGEVTTVLLSALGYAKDNRLLPQGFDKATAENYIAVRGLALEDDDFVGGGDQIRYRIDLQGTEGPWAVEAELWYQPIAFRWAHNLADHQADEIEHFVAYFEEAAEVSALLITKTTAIAD